jgi:hypothetical protein
MSQPEPLCLSEASSKRRHPLAKARCSGCGRTSAPRVIGTAPDGWRKFVDRVLGAVTYRCPNCPGRPVSADGQHTGRGRSD